MQKNNFWKYEKDPWKNFVTIPIPPKPILTPTRTKAVVTVAAGVKGKALFEISGELLKAYADRMDADFIVLDWPGVPEWGISSKFQLSYMLDYYERVLYLDSDILIPQTAINLFDYAKEDGFYAYDDLPDILRDGGGFIEEYQHVRITQGLKRSKLNFYLNTGVMLFSKKHQYILSIPSLPIPPCHCSEQHLWVARLQDSTENIIKLPKIANWQWWTDKDFIEAPDNAILHFSGMQEFSEDFRLYKMRMFKNKLIN